MKITKYEGNPILSPLSDSEFESKCVLNPAVVFDEERQKFMMVYRAAGSDMAHVIRFGLASSDDGIHFTRYEGNPVFSPVNGQPDGGCVEDPRIVKIGKTYFMTYAARCYAPGPYWLPDWPFPPIYLTDKDVHTDDMPFFAKSNITITYLASSLDLINWQRLGRLTEPDVDDRDVLLFPRKINGRYYMISRPKFVDAPEAKIPSIWISSGNDLLSFSSPKLLFTGGNEWQTERIGAGTPPIETKYGWFFLFHGVDKKGVYRVGACILDKDDPSKIVAKTNKWIMEPDAPFELEGIYNGCVFPTGTVVKDGILYIYYGCADTHIAVATVNFDDLLNYVMEGN